MSLSVERRVYLQRHPVQQMNQAIPSESGFWHAVIQWLQARAFLCDGVYADSIRSDPRCFLFLPRLFHTPQGLRSGAVRCVPVSPAKYG